MKPDDRLLRVPVVALGFRPGLEMVETFQTALALDPKAKCWAIVSNGDAQVVRDAWQADPDSTLVIIRAERDAALGVACELLETLAPGPAALLLANLPAHRSLLPSRKYAPESIRRLEESHPDLQVHLHCAEWLRRPPRVR
ncbi:MAG: hypothetical protein KIT11_05220 [Fimbriimonadaceae bacterium]|nr:hypothetical protein [Fimbriimonadaceae bacterium]QYK56707.1 MAG: hypothetical protein KF733_04300 [Fimbriimonadaceae bacterium]